MSTEPRIPTVAVNDRLLSMKFLLQLALYGCASLLYAQVGREVPPEPKFSELSHEDGRRLDQQRALVAAVAKQRYSTASLTRTKTDMPILQRILDDKVFRKSQTYELQS
jgi:hypothetical protein